MWTHLLLHPVGVALNATLGMELEPLVESQMGVIDRVALKPWDARDGGEAWARRVGNARALYFMASSQYSGLYSLGYITCLPFQS